MLHWQWWRWKTSLAVWKTKENISAQRGSEAPGSFGQWRQLLYSVETLATLWFVYHHYQSQVPAAVTTFSRSACAHCSPVMKCTVIISTPPVSPLMSQLLQFAWLNVSKWNYNSPATSLFGRIELWDWCNWLKLQGVGRGRRKNNPTTMLPPPTPTAIFLPRQREEQDKLL